MVCDNESMDAPGRLLGLLRLASRGSNAFPPERQLALDRALDIARRIPVAVEDLLEKHRIDVSDLRCPRWRLPQVGSGAALRYPHLMATYGASRHGDSPSREECAGTFPIAGFRYYEARAHRHRMRIGDPVSLVRVIGNPHDRHAVFLKWNGLDLGHLPRGSNEAVWRYLATRAPLEARVAGVEAGRYGTIEIEIR